MKNNEGGFTSSFGAIAAAAGSAIGLGNIWRFPYTAGANGGGAFLLLYIVFVFLIGVPIMMSELTIGRRSGQNAVGAFRVLSPRQRGWMLVGFWGVLTTFFIYSFYSVITGWTLDYVDSRRGERRLPRILQWFILADFLSDYLHGHHGGGDYDGGAEGD